MKLFKGVFTILLVAIFTISCGGDDDNDSPETLPAKDYFMKAKIDGVDYKADGMRVLASKTTNEINITSVLADNRNFEIELNYATRVGTYVIPEPKDRDYTLKLVYGEGNVSSSVFSAGACTGTTGTLIITSITETDIAGTFSFTAKKAGGCANTAKEIAEGSFKAAFIK